MNDSHLPEFNGSTDSRLLRGPRLPILLQLLLLAICSGLTLGLIEGVGLLTFQRINWERWGRMIHASEEILWISALVDVVFFCQIATLTASLATFLARRYLVRLAVAAFAAFAVYDLLQVTSRIHTMSSLLFALGVAVVASGFAVKHEAALFRVLRKTAAPLLVTSFFALVLIAGDKWFEERRATALLPQAAQGAPNVIVIVVDTLRADHLSCYGYSKITTPNIDQLAQEGVVFENAFSTSPWSLPSHVSLVTGRYQFEHGIERVQSMSPLSWGKPKLGKYPTIGEFLQQKGYRTGAFSGNRIYFSSDLGFLQGFLHFEDYFHSAGDMFVRTTLGKELVRDFQFSRWHGLRKRFLQRVGLGALLDRDEEGAADAGGPSTLRKRASVVNEEMFNWIQQDSGRPFFAFLNYFDVHTPYGTPDSGVVYDSNNENDASRYDDGVAYVDRQIGALFAGLKRRGLDRNTLVILTSDHGEALGQHGLPTHGKSLYYSLIRIPLLFWYPAHIPAGKRISPPVTNASIASSILSLAGAGDESLPAHSLVAYWAHPNSVDQNSPVLAELGENKFPEKLDHEISRFVMTSRDGPMKSLIDSDWHLIVHKNLGDQLYNRHDDPDESRNLVTTDDGRTVHSYLLLAMQSILSHSFEGPMSGSRFIPIKLGESVHSWNAAQRSESPVNWESDFRLSANGGDIVSIEVHSDAHEPHGFDPVLTVYDDRRQMFETCRNPGDDRVPPPGLSDPTPDAFDDLCWNDDVERFNYAISRLELSVPGTADQSVTLLIRVSDWNGAPLSSRAYTISASPARHMASAPNGNGPNNLARQ